MMFVKVGSKIHAFDLLWSTFWTGSHLPDCERCFDLHTWGKNIHVHQWWCSM